MRYDRKISPGFMRDLKTGRLSPLLARIKEDDTLMLAIREKYINIYYRGGNILNITEVPTRYPDVRATYEVKFDTNYYLGASPLPVGFPLLVRDDRDVSRLIDKIPDLKYTMDRFFSRWNRSEREFQQLVVRENNLSSVANETEYFVIDIELAGVVESAKFDMIAVRWLSHQRARPEALVPVLIEMKYGNNALNGDAGLIKHLVDAYALREDEELWQDFRTGIQGHISQLESLDLLRFNRSVAVPELRLHPTKTPELIFLLADYNPRARAILDIMPEFNKILNERDPQDSEQKEFDVRFFQASFAGYGMHHVSMLTPTDFERLAQKLYDDSRSRKL